MIGAAKFSTGGAMPSPSSIFSAYASITAAIMLIRSMANELVPQPVRGYLLSAFRYFFKPCSQSFTLVIEDFVGLARNQVYDAAETYLCTKVSPDTERLKISKTNKDGGFTIRLVKGEKLVDLYNEVELQWRFKCAESDHWSTSSIPNIEHPPPRPEKRCFELSFHKKHKDLVLNYYMPFILERAKAMKDQERVLKMHTLSSSYSGKWDSINLVHPSTFETLAMEPDLKNAILEDLNRFLQRKEFYKKVGRPWKRGYLLYGPPGTGKSSLIAAMANYLKFDIHDLQLANIARDSDLRKLLLSTANRTILVIEDIDCSVELSDRRVGDGSRKQTNEQLTLSGLLNFIDGLWSGCEDERIIIFTTNHKERLDPALLRPGRMDMHIHMSYCTYEGFKLLASNYLGIPNHHHLLGVIESMIQETQITPAEVAEELMKSEDSDVALQGIVKILKRKKTEVDVYENDFPEKDAVCRDSKKGKTGNKKKKYVRITRKNCKVKRI